MSLKRSSARSPKGSRDSARDLKFPRLATNMAGETNFVKVVSARFSELFRQFQMSKHSFKPLCWNLNENGDVDVAIDRAYCQSKKQHEKTTLKGP